MQTKMVTTVVDARQGKLHDDKEFLRLEQLFITLHQVMSVSLFVAEWHMHLSATAACCSSQQSAGAPAAQNSNQEPFEA